MESEVWEPLEAKYKPELLRLAREIRSDLRGHGLFATAPSDWTGDDLTVDITVRRKGREPIGITLRLLDAHAWDGTESGTSFALDVVAEGGRIVGGLHPHNYSDRVWVDPTDPDAVAERWDDFYGALDAGDIADLIFEFWSSAESE